MNSPIIISSYTDDGPEEGEILSDDFEEISDDSISFPPNNYGKCFSHSENLPELSLSSVSEYEDSILRNKCSKRRKNFKERSRKKPKQLNSDSSDSESFMVSSQLKFQLKAAVHRNGEETQKNPLMTRLLAMEKGSSGPESDVIGNKTPIVLNLDDPIASLAKPESSSDNSELFGSTYEDQDTELRQLRIEALKTAVNNKFAKRKKKKIESNNLINEMNKENTNNNLESENKTDNNQINSESNNHESDKNSLDEDEDVLRALLLASMSKKITNSQDDDPKLPVSSSKETKTLKTVKSSNKVLTIPQVKPLIICVNSDSDSDSECTGSPEKIPIKENNIDIKTVINNNNNSNKGANIETSIDKFLKEQRAKVEKEVETTNGTILKGVIKKPIVKTSVTNKSMILKKQELEKSALKFLPANKREEYQKLQNLLKLRKAQIKRNNAGEKKLSKITQVVSVQSKNIKDVVTRSESVQTKSTQTTKSYMQLSAKSEARLKEFRHHEYVAAKREQEKRKETIVLRNILKKLQSNDSGRLQIQEKYRNLRPLVRKLNSVSKQQKQWDSEIEQLVERLREARKKQGVLHQEMLQSVKELSDEKKKIDLSLNEKSLPTFGKESIDSSVNDQINEKSKDCEEMSDNKTSDTAPYIYTTYISPLDIKNRRTAPLNPFLILCPFEVNGTCKDSECRFNHLPK